MVMKFNKAIIASAIAVAVAASSGAAASATPSQEVVEARQESQIWTTYALSPYLRANDLKVSVHEGRATLTGNVAEDVNKDLAKQIALGVDGIKSVKVNRVVRRLRAPGPLTFGRGIEISVSVDEMAFEGSNAFLLGAVLDRYFARHVSINSFTETVLRSESRGDINRWVPQWGTRPTL